MDVRQVWRDLLLRLKQDRKSQVIFAVIVIAVVWAMSGEPPREREVVVELEPQVGTGAMSGEEAYNDLITRFSRDLQDIKDSTDLNREQLTKQREDLQAYEERTAEIFKKIIERMADLEQNTGGMNQGAEPLDTEGDGLGELQESTMEQFGQFDVADVEVPPPPPPRKEAIVGAGDSVRIKLIAGAHAPTDGTPYPVLFELIDDVIGPDNSMLPLGNARLIAAAQGSLTDSRALFRLTQLNISYPDGSRNVIDVDGWVVGEDGIRGMEGILLDPLGKQLLGAGIAGGVSGLGEGIAGSNTTTIFSGANGTATTYVDGDKLEYAGGRGLAEAGDMYAEVVRERGKLLVPHVRVLSGRTATAVFSKSFRIDGLYDQLDVEEASFQGLD